jgi:hypothetical protein
LPTPYDPQVSSPEHQVEDLKDDPDLTFLKEQDFGIIGIDGPLHLFPKSTSDTLEGASSTADGGVEIFNTNFEMRPPVEYFVENYSISTDTWNDADGLNEPFDAGTVETWPTLTEPFLGPFYPQFFSSESFVQ